MDVDTTAQLSSSSYYSGLYCCSSRYKRGLETGRRVEHGAGDKFKYLWQPSTIHNLQSTSRHISVSRVAVSVYLPGGLTMQCMYACNIAIYALILPFLMRIMIFSPRFRPFFSWNFMLDMPMSRLHIQCLVTRQHMAGGRVRRVRMDTAGKMEIVCDGVWAKC